MKCPADIAIGTMTQLFLLKHTIKLIFNRTPLNFSGAELPIISIESSANTGLSDFVKFGWKIYWILFFFSPVSHT